MPCLADLSFSPRDSQLRIYIRYFSKERNMKIARNLCTKFSVFISLALLISGGALLHGTAFADETFTQTATITLPGASANVPGSLTSFDIGFVDPQLGFYFLADRTNKTVDEIRTSDNHITRQLAKGELVGANGVITANNHKEVWIGDNVDPNTGTSSVKVISLATGHVTRTIDTKGTKGRTDELCVDPQHHVVLAANDVDLFVKFISTDTYKVIGTLFFDGSDRKAQNVKSNNGIEQCQWSPRTGKFYLNIPQVGGTPGKNDTPGVVVMINPASMMVQKVFPIESSSVCRGNQGLAIGPQRELLIGCSASGTGSVILDELNGSEIRSLPGLNGSDEVWYNPGDNHYFLALGNHTAGGVVGGQRLRSSASPTSAGMKTSRTQARRRSEALIRLRPTRLKTRYTFQSMGETLALTPPFAALV